MLLSKLTELVIVGEAKTVHKPRFCHSKGEVGSAEDVGEVSFPFDSHQVR